jgi:hypothetical protein
MKGSLKNMSLVADAIKSVAEKGQITHECTIQGLKFVLRSLKTEENIIADGMVDTDKVSEKYGAKNLITLNDTLNKYRTIAMISLATETVNGKPPVDSKVSLEDQFKQREEFRDELMGSGAAFVDALIREYNFLLVKEREFYVNINENLEK